MEVLAISALFVLIVVGAECLGVYLFLQALARDRRYQLAVGELSLVHYDEEDDDGSLVLDTAEPFGTLAVLLVYLMILIGLWFAMLAILLQRS